MVVVGIVAVFAIVVVVGWVFVVCAIVAGSIADVEVEGEVVVVGVGVNVVGMVLFGVVAGIEVVVVVGVVVVGVVGLPWWLR